MMSRREAGQNCATEGEMTDPKSTGETTSEVYEMFRADPDAHPSSYLHNHYRRG